MTTPASRREFLKRASLLSSLGPGAGLALSLAAMGEASAQAAGDYKALVCIFLGGGCDHANTIIPVDNDSYRAYQRGRPAVALSQVSLQATRLVGAPPTGPSGQHHSLAHLQFALAPNLGALLPYFNQKKQLSVMLNVGALAAPTTKALYGTASHPKPPNLFSHNDQVSYIQSLKPEGAKTGWGGRIADLMMAQNGQSVFTAVSTGGPAVYLSGADAVQYQLNREALAKGAFGTNPFTATTDLTETIKSLARAPSGDPFDNVYAKVTNRGLNALDVLTKTLAQDPGGSRSDLSRQLSDVASMISVRGNLGLKRQVFMVTLNGFDTHSNLVDRHGALMRILGDAMAEFQAKIDLMGLTESVTTFTATDFGRTLTLNTNDGSDHGWGSHGLIMGGAVKGGHIFGKPPVLADNGPDDIGRGRLVPSIGTSQVAALLATWMGAGNHLDTILPGYRAKFGSTLLPWSKA